MEYHSRLDKNRIAYLGALTLLFSYAEMLLPRGIPFFRLGLGNIAVLLAFNLNIYSYVVLLFIKSIASSLMAGTLFSPFFFISLGQSVISGLGMYGIYKLCRGKIFSLYGISILGSAVSAIVQITLSGMYLGKGTFALSGPMLLFSVFSGIVTAFLAGEINFPIETPELKIKEKEKNESKIFVLIKIILLLVFAVSVFFIKNLYVLIVGLIAALTLQVICGRKIKIIPHISMWLFVIISCMFVPNGEVLYKFGFVVITKGALFTGIEKAIKLSTVSALSQCLAGFKPEGNSLLSVVLLYFGALCDVMNNTQGNIFVKVSTALQKTDLYCE